MGIAQEWAPIALITVYALEVATVLSALIEQLFHDRRGIGGSR